MAAWGESRRSSIIPLFEDGHDLLSGFFAEIGLLVIIITISVCLNKVYWLLRWPILRGTLWQNLRQKLLARESSRLKKVFVDRPQLCHGADVKITFT
jgi:hypothetical protein